MKHTLVVLFVLFAVAFPVNVSAQENDGFKRTSAQKGVGISTDICVIAMPVATLAGILMERDWEGLKQGALTAVTEVGASLILKYAIKEDRPDHSNTHSFPSGHTGIAFANATFLQRRYGWKFGVPAYVIAGYVGWGRVYSKKHHWWDVLAGAAIGVGTALIYTRPFAEKHEFTFIPEINPARIGFHASITL